MKIVQDKDGNVVKVANDTPCHAGKNGALPIMLDPLEDADIFAAMIEKKKESAKAKKEYIATEKYKDDRRKEYATIGDQLDMIYWDAMNGTTAFIDHRTTVKLNHPKRS